MWVCSTHRQNYMRLISMSEMTVNPKNVVSWKNKKKSLKIKIVNQNSRIVINFWDQKFSRWFLKTKNKNEKIDEVHDPTNN